MDQKWLLAAGVLGAAIGFGWSAAPAQASYIVTLTQVGSNVIATGSGTIDLAGLTLDASGMSFAAVTPSSGQMNIGPASAMDSLFYGGYVGPTSFGSGVLTVASTGTGDIVGIGAFSVDLVVPSGYVSGNALSDSSTYDNQTFASLGLTLGDYTWTWGSGTTADSFEIEVGAPSTPSAVPEPASLALFGSALLGLGLLRRKRQGA